jgi:hypothetical protein
MVRAAVTEVAAMDRFRHLRVDVDPWMDEYAASKRTADAMPLALTHGQMYFQQVGRRSGGPLVLFDLATLDVRPRFSDLCSLVGGLADRVDVDEPSILERYLEQLRVAGAEGVPDLAVAWRELRALRALSGFQTLPWMVSAHRDPDIGFESLVGLVETLAEDLADGAHRG